MDSEDQLRAIRRLLKSQNLDEERWVPKEIMWFINARKDEGLRAKHIRDDGDPTKRQFIKLYELYLEALIESWNLARGVPKVACPMHKKTFSLVDGKCLTGESYCVSTFPVKVVGEQVLLELPSIAEVERIVFANEHERLSETMRATAAE